MKKIPSFYLVFATVIGCLSTIFLYKITAKPKQIIPASEITAFVENKNCDYKLKRLAGYKYVEPLLFITKDCESGKFSSLKAGIDYYISEQKDADPLSKVSVYLCDLSKEGDWMGINTEQEYSPGSLLKVVLLITHLKAAESNPGILDKKITFKKNGYVTPPKQHFNSQTIVPGNTYTVRELLKYMVAYSDNYATWLLNDYVNKDLLQKTFTDFGFAKPNLMDMNYKIGTKEYSYFMRALYNGGYLTISSSEFALSLLTECDFKEGITKNLPSTVIVAHKFGETGLREMHQLHESGIIFLNNSPYLLTIMTQGKDVDHQAEILSNISNMVYSFMVSKQS